MLGPDDWTRALEQADIPTRFSLDFARLGLIAECRSLSATEINQALTLPGEAAARKLLYLACPSLQEAGESMAAAGVISRAADITLRLPYSDVLQAASLILHHSGGGKGMVQIAATADTNVSTEQELPAMPHAAESSELDGYALLRQWAAEDRAADISPSESQGHDAFSSTLLLRQTWAQTTPMQEVHSANSAAQWTNSPAVTNMTEQVAWELCQRLRDAAGNM